MLFAQREKFIFSIHILKCCMYVDSSQEFRIFYSISILNCLQYVDAHVYLNIPFSLYLTKTLWFFFVPTTSNPKFIPFSFLSSSSSSFPPFSHFPSPPFHLLPLFSSSLVFKTSLPWILNSALIKLILNSCWRIQDV